MSKIDTGSLQRIADANERMAASCELMAKNHAALINERDMYERWYKDKARRVEKLEHRIRSLKGVITRLRKQISDRRDGK